MAGCESTFGRIKQLEIDLDAAQKRGEKLEQKNIELSSSALLLREKTERSSRVLGEAWTVLQNWQSSPLHERGS
jgi:hypothetical protein